MTKTALWLMVGLLVPLEAGADVLTGVVTTTVRAGTQAAPVVVYAEPLDGPAPARQLHSVAVSQRNKTFSPRVLAVPAGTSVSFPNDDDIFHNVFSRSQKNTFDLGLYRAGASKSRTFATPGVVRIFCNIHPQMTALVVAAPTPWVVTAGADGAWRLDLPAGRYRLTAMSERAAATTAEVTVSGATPSPPLTLDESGFVAVPHTNKFGKPYLAPAYKQP